MLLALLPLALPLAQQHATPAAAAAARIAANSNRTSGGRMVSGELRVQLETRLGRWFPEGKRDPSQVMQAFAEVGHAPQIPGPLIRVKTGTRIRASLHNTLDKPLTIYGLYTRPGSAKDTVQIAPGATRDIRFAAGAPGTYFYWGKHDW
jgi:manganese oxidase